MDKTWIRKQSSADVFLVAHGKKNARAEYTAVFEWEKRYVLIAHVGVSKWHKMPKDMNMENMLDPEYLPTLWENHMKVVLSVQDNEKNPNCICECTCMQF